MIINVSKWYHWPTDLYDFKQLEMQHFPYYSFYCDFTANTLSITLDMQCKKKHLRAVALSKSFLQYFTVMWQHLDCTFTKWNQSQLFGRCRIQKFLLSQLYCDTGRDNIAELVRGTFGTVTPHQHLRSLVTNIFLWWCKSKCFIHKKSHPKLRFAFKLS